MAIKIGVPTEAQWPEMFRADARSFGYVPTREDLDERRPVIDLARFRVATDNNEIVGIAGSFGLNVTLPGGGPVPMSGITWVSVAATHRRQGLLTRLMEECHHDSRERGEPVAMLYASEGGIYERFGYGTATSMHSVAIDRAAAKFRPHLTPTPRAVGFIDGEKATQHRSRIWEQRWRRRAAEVSRDTTWQEHLSTMWSKPQGNLTAAFCLAHDEGYAVYRIGESWADNVPQHRLVVVDFVALTDRAHFDLWHTLVGVDLVATIAVRSLPKNDPLPYYFTNARAVRTTSITDGVWANVFDVGRCFGTRSYATKDRFVVEADGRRWAIESDGTASSCRSVRSRPDLVVDQPSLGALLFGGVRPSLLAAAGRITVRSSDVAGHADAFFMTTPAPHCQTMF